jgi:hypothetical protein
MKKPAKVYIEDNSIYLKLPFTMTGLDMTEQFSTADVPRRLFSHGKSNKTDVTWNVEKKAWSFSFTEDNLIFIQNFLESLNVTNIEYSDEVLEYQTEVYNIKNSPEKYNIELCVDNDLKPYIKNAPDSLLKYLNDQKLTDLWRLIDRSHELGYGLSDKVKLMIGDSVEHVMVSNSRISLGGTLKEKEKKLKGILMYALKYNRIPIVFHSPERLLFGAKVTNTGVSNSKKPIALKHEKIVDPQFDPMVFKVVRQLMKEESVGEATRFGKKDCLIYYSHTSKDLIESEINPQIIFFTRMVNERTFNIFLDHIPKVCYYNTVNSPLDEESNRLLMELGPGNEYYAKM